MPSPMKKTRFSGSVPKRSWGSWWPMPPTCQTGLSFDRLPIPRLPAKRRRSSAAAWRRSRMPFRSWPRTGGIETEPALIEQRCCARSSWPMSARRRWCPRVLEPWRSQPCSARASVPVCFDCSCSLSSPLIRPGYRADAAWPRQLLDSDGIFIDEVHGGTAAAGFRSCSPSASRSRGPEPSECVRTGMMTFAAAMAADRSLAGARSSRPRAPAGNPPPPWFSPFPLPPVSCRLASSSSCSPDLCVDVWRGRVVVEQSEAREPRSSRP